MCVCLGLTIMLSPIVVKTYRVYRLFNNKSLAQLQETLKDSVLLKGVALMIFCIFLFVAVTLVLGVPHAVVIKSDTASSPGVTVYVVECRDTQWYELLTYVYISCLVLSCTYLAWRVRNVPDKFNESRNISFFLAFFLMFGVIILPLQLMSQHDPSQQALLRGFGLLVAVGVCSGSIFIPKLLHLVRKEETQKEPTELTVHTEVHS